MRFQGAIFDVDGVLVDSPHSRAWRGREALRELMDTEWVGIRGCTSYPPERFTQAVYQQVVAGLPWLAGARAALEYFGVPDVGRRAERRAAVKQEHITRLIKSGLFTAFADALRFVLNVKAAGIPVAAASSSKNADLLLQQVRLDTFAAEQHLDSPLTRPGLTLLGLLGAAPARCFVAEDAVSGVRAAKAGGMAALGLARLGDELLLRGAGADLVVDTLDAVSLPALAEGRLVQREDVPQR